MRLTELLHSNNRPISKHRHRQIRKRLPLVVIWKNGEPTFNGKPKTREQAVRFLRDMSQAKEFEKGRDIKAPKCLVIVPEGGDVPDLRTWLMDKFDIKQADVEGS